MAAPSTAAAKWLQYLAARVAEMSLSMFPPEANLRSATALGQLLYRFDHRHRQRALDHLAIAFPDADDRWRQEMARRTFEHLVQLVVEVTASPRRLTTGGWRRFVRPSQRGLGPVLEMLDRGQPVLLITGHLGNWEVLGTMITLLGHQLDAIARPIDNPLINDWLMGIRQKRGLGIITKFGATDRMVHVLDSGGALGFIADQNAGPRGVFVPFFGRLASTYKSIALLAMKQEVPVVTGSAHRLGRDFVFEVDVDDVIHPGDWASQRDPMYYITARYMRSIEAMVRRHPDQYLWMHRRWKSRPRFEREGKPMPASFQTKLESLPWMDQPTLDLLKQPLRRS